MASSREPDKAEAGRRLAAEVASRWGIPSAVAAVSAPGGLVGTAIGRAFARPLAFVYCAPLVLPWEADRRSAFGAADPDGRVVLDYAALAAERVSDQEIESARGAALEEIRRFYSRAGVISLIEVLPTPRLLLVDDELSPGWCMEAAIAFARRHGVQRILVAGVRACAGGAAWFESDVNGFVALERDAPPALEWRRGSSRIF